MVLKTKKMSSCTTPALRVKDEKCIFDACFNGINVAHFQAVFYVFFNTAIRANCSTCMMPSWVSYFLPSSMSSLKPMMTPSSPPLPHHPHLFPLLSQLTLFYFKPKEQLKEWKKVYLEWH